MPVYFWRFVGTLIFIVYPIISVAYGQDLSAGKDVLAPGDALEITVWRRPELSGKFTIAADGSISHPLYRTIQAARIPLSTVEERLRTYLETLESNPQFVLQPLLRVAVGGEVRQPNLYRLPPETSIAEAVALAGGLTDRGRIERVHLIREQDTTVTYVDLRRTSGGAAAMVIRSGDQIFVERRRSIWREYVTPAGSIVAALVSLVSLLTR